MGLGMEDINKPKERDNFVVFAGITRDGQIQFIRVYAIDETLALEALEQFLKENHIHPSDFVVVEQGYEDVEGKEVITTRTEEELSAILARAGLKLVSNGILYLKGRDKIYQITAISRELLESRRDTEEVIEDINLDFSNVSLPEKYTKRLSLLSLMEDTLILNRVELDLSELLKKTISGTVAIPRLLEYDGIIVRVFDEEFHIAKGSYLDKVLVDPPIIHWDAHIDSVEDFSFKKIEENVYSAPLFLKAFSGFLVLTEPPRDLVRMLLKMKKRGEVKVTLDGKRVRLPVNFTIIVDTKYPENYSGLKFPVRINLPPMDDETFSSMLSEALGISVPQDLTPTFPEEYRTFLGIEIITNLWKKLKEKEKKDGIELLREVAAIVSGGVP
ncbi:hypothetical protein A3L04_04960 [Thermococcus chitonophagus]|uniref:Uncharacterized protein n=2 Tax=Thermococcus chitonophagus TaxID=54262 RepID=A0A2Z2N813_9EURY|nr:hypothetical protein [Thermococcus chitonophagus]ASJ16470.1 hypothetical protein A3L04_04960 [Thermococcus chitonophagus]